MNYKIPASKKSSLYKKNPLEKTHEDDFDPHFLDQLFGSRQKRASQENIPSHMMDEKKEQPLPQRKEFTIFAHDTHSENYEVPKQIEQLAGEVKQAVQQLKRSQKALDQQILQVEKHTIDAMPQKGGIYHVHFLEKLLSFIKLMQSKVGEAKTWLSAMQSKKKKRGSAFAMRSKQKGTQYSQSQELSTARAVQ